MASGRAADWEDPSNSRRKAARILDRDPIRELHQGRRSYAPHREAGHMTAPDHIANATSKNPCMRGPSTYEFYKHGVSYGWDGHRPLLTIRPRPNEHCQHREQRD